LSIDYEHVICRLRKPNVLQPTIATLRDEIERLTAAG
jgi:hypothetical protein